MGLFENTVDAGRPADQTGFQFPARLTERYRPRTFAEFIGLEKPKRFLTRFAQCPRPDALLFVGPSGVGKTSIALAFCEAINGELHHIPSQECNLQSLENVVAMCHRAPWNFFGANAGPAKWHVVLVDEAHKMSNAAQLYLLSKTDETCFPPKTVFVFTCNTLEGLQEPFVSRCKQLPFSSHGLAEDAAQYLERIWEREAGQAEKPNFLRIMRESGNNVRNALNMLETEILAA